MAKPREITYDIVENVGVIKRYASGWTKEVNIISWNEGIPKFDIRDWDENREHLTRGMTFTDEEMFKLVDFINEWKEKHNK